jgi:hypothetical protein
MRGRLRQSCADTDIVVASAKALINALNRVLAVQRPADTEVRTSP